MARLYEKREAAAVRHKLPFKIFRLKSHINLVDAMSAYGGASRRLLWLHLGAKLPLALLISTQYCEWAHSEASARIWQIIAIKDAI